jgi:arylamine N-acetyltransferase
MSGLGGHCGALNLFAWQILKVLGYSVHFCGGIIPYAGITTFTAVHLTIIIKDLVNPGDIHHVDCGFGHPSFTPISLNFHEESPIFQHSYLEYKYIKHDGKILRMHGDGDLARRNNPPIEGGDFIRGKWRRLYEFTLEDFERKTWGSFEDYFDIRCSPKNVRPWSAAYPDGKAILIAGNNLYVEQEDRKLKKTRLESDDEIIKAYKEHFPIIDENTVSLAYSTWARSNLMKWR